VKTANWNNSVPRDLVADRLLWSAVDERSVDTAFGERLGSE
jgi:hypothetical protein